jgi:hypothetical protein
VNIVEMRLEIAFVADHVLPIAALPDVALAFADAALIC